MNPGSYYNAARAFVAFDAFMVVAFTVTLVGMARALSLRFVRTLAVVWVVYVVRVMERSWYFALADRTTLLASLLVGVFAATCVMPVLLLRHAMDDDLDMTRSERMGGPHDAHRNELRVGRQRLTAWGAAAFAMGFFVHAGSARLDANGFELASAVWSRAFAGVPLLVLLVLTGVRRSTQRALQPLFWGFAVQLGALFVDAVVRSRSFGADLTRLDEQLVSGMTLASTLAVGIASILAVVEQEREVMAYRARRLQVAQERALESERWQQVGQLARGVAHDLNNVLGALLTGGDLVVEGVRTRAADTDVDYAELDQALTNGRSLTGRLLRFTRPQPVHPRSITVGDIGRDLLPTLRRLVGSERHLVVEFTDAQCVMADAAAIEQVLLNLVVNARDATAPGGQIVLRVEDTDLTDTPTLAVGSLGGGRYVCIVVEDNGCGMPDDVLARLWEPFFTTKGDRGSGIGLPTVASLMTEMHGAIDVHSVDGAGSRFRVWLPVALQGT